MPKILIPKNFKTFVISVAIFLSLFLQTESVFAQVGALDISNIDKGVIGYHIAENSSQSYMLMIKKDDKTYYYYLNNGKKDYFPLQMGNGKYKVVLLEKISGNKYKVVQSDEVTLNIKDEKQVFLNSVQNIKWMMEDAPIKKAAELTKGVTKDSEKIKIIYNYIISNYKYDKEKAKTLSSPYIPDITDIFNKKKGICFDYSSLFAAMLRSLNIPAKLVMGTSSLTKYSYHAWNEVYISDAGKWVIIDTTVDASFKNANKPYSMEKSPDKYFADKVY